MTTAPGALKWPEPARAKAVAMQRQLVSGWIRILKLVTNASTS